jgi:hypothetical protein
MHRLPDPSEQSRMIEEQHAALKKEEARIARQKEEEHQQSVRTHMEWCDLAILAAMHKGFNECRFDIKPILHSLDYYDAERTLSSVMAAVVSKEPYSAERIPHNLSIKITWPMDDALRKAAKDLLLLDKQQQALTSNAQFDPFSRVQKQERTCVAQSCIDLLTTCNKFAESERIKRGR